MTAAERLLWRALRRRQLQGFRFRRQQVISGYIVDFYCPAARLAVEVDGGSHIDTKTYDAERDHALYVLGISTLRVSNQSVEENLAEVLRTIAEEVQRLTLTASHDA